jgi:hypothetical protein
VKPGRHLIVVSDSDPESGDRWIRFVEKLVQELRASGLGTLFREEQPASGRREVVVSLAHPGYGRELVDRLVADAGLPPRATIVPGRWEAFSCVDYFESRFARTGSADSSGFSFVLPLNEIYEDSELELLVIGGPGCDGIVWGYRPQMMGIWAWYPIDGTFALMASDIDDLVHGWRGGSVVV